MVEGTSNHSMVGIKLWMDIHILYKVLGGASDDQVKSVAITMCRTINRSAKRLAAWTELSSMW